jgi:hypothetical protein
MDPISFAKKIFTNEPKDKFSIQLHLNTEEMDMGDLFEFLLLVFTNGLRILYGNNNEKVDLSTLNNEQLTKVNDYFNSFGFDTSYIIYSEEMESVIDFNKLSYRNTTINTDTKIENLCFPIKIYDKIYVIGFAFLVGSGSSCK